MTDSYIINNIYLGRRNGYFIDIGAGDGVTNSNTYLLETTYDWKGTCIEPNPQFYLTMSDKRKCNKLPYAAYSENKLVNYVDSGETSQIMKEKEKEQIKSIKSMKVIARTLLSILDESNAPQFIEFMNISAKGVEYDILSNFDFTKYTIGYICINSDRQVRKLLEENNYLFNREYMGKDEYIHNNLINKMDILFLNNIHKQCSVYQYGLRTFNILKNDNQHNYIYIEVDTYSDYKKVLEQYQYADAIIYNYHSVTMSWLNIDNIQKNVKNIGIQHSNNTDLFHINLFPNVCKKEQPKQNIYTVPRPIYENVDNILKNYVPSSKAISEFIEYREGNKPIFGSFGFGFMNKGFDKIVKLINSTYNEAIIKFIIPCASHDPEGMRTVEKMIELCKSCMFKSGITLMIETSFVSDYDLLKFLNSNTLNLFLYDMSSNDTLSTCIDFALSSGKPLAISNSNVFNHIYDDIICLDYAYIDDCIDNSVAYYSRFLKEFSNSNLINKFGQVLNSIGKSNNANILALRLGSDKHVIENIFKHKENGFFVEIGMYNRVDTADTCELQKKYKWDGVCIEENPRHCNIIQKVRKIKAVNNVLSNVNNNDVKIVDSDSIEYETHLVKSKRLETILSEIEAPQIIDLLVLNTDGTELEILQGHNFTNYMFKYLCVEYGCNEGTRIKTREFLESKGYIFFRENGLLNEYIHISMIHEMSNKLPNAQILSAKESVAIEIEKDIVADPFLKKLDLNSILKRDNPIGIDLVEFNKNTEQNKPVGIFYNSEKSLCSIWESGMMCYNALKKSDKFSLIYTESKIFSKEYDFVIINEHFVVNNWLTPEIIGDYNKPIYCIVTEVTPGDNPIKMSPSYFTKYIVLDPSFADRDNIYGFSRPLEEVVIGNTLNIPEYDIPVIGSFGFATEGKLWHKIVEQVQYEFDNALIKFNIPKGTHVPEAQHTYFINNILEKTNNIIIKPGIKIEITQNNYTKEELIEWCSKNTINVFFYYREKIFSAGLSAVTDQAIASGKPLLVTGDNTFRHIHKYIPFFPVINIREAIVNTPQGVSDMKRDWSPQMFLNKFEQVQCN